MKAALLFYHSVYDDQLRAILERLGCDRYVEIPQAWAVDAADRRFGTHIYPGVDSIIVAFVPDETAEQLTAAITAFKRERQQEHTHLALVAVDRFV